MNPRAESRPVFHHGRGEDGSRRGLPSDDLRKSSDRAEKAAGRSTGHPSFGRAQGLYTSGNRACHGTVRRIAHERNRNENPQAGRSQWEFPAEKLYKKAGFVYTTTIPMFYEDTGWAEFSLYEYPLISS